MTPAGRHRPLRKATATGPPGTTRTTRATKENTLNLIRTIPAAAAFAALALGFPSGAGAAIPFGASALPPTGITAITTNGDAGTVLTATLTSPSGPVAGAAVTFTEAGASVVLCAATTDADGLAQCPVTQRQVTLIRGDQGIWWARFGGSATLAPVAKAGHI